jgi:osmotically inducible protein OsmC
MATFERHADVDWTGSVMEGKGEAKAGTGAFTLPVSFPARVGDPGGKTSPEELIAGAHATCLSMALSHGLASAGTPPTTLTTEAVCTFGQLDEGFGITSMRLTVRGVVEGLDDAGFKAAAEQAVADCPVSRALSGNVEISLDAALEGAG